MMWTLRTPLVERLQAGFDLGDHAGLDRPAGDQLAGFVGGERVDQRVGVVLVAADAVHVAEEDQLFGPQRLGHGRGGRVGVDVQLLAAASSMHIDGITGTWPA